MLDGTRNIEEIVFSTGLGPLAIYQAWLASDGFGSGSGSWQQGYNLDGSSSADLLDRRRLGDKVEQTRHQDYFTILGISRQATPYEIPGTQKAGQVRSDEFLREYHKQYKRELNEIEGPDDAFEVLQDDGLRLAYARNLPR